MTDLERELAEREAMYGLPDLDDDVSAIISENGAAITIRNGTIIAIALNSPGSAYLDITQATR